MGPTLVNDVHSRLNRTTVAGVVRPRGVEEAAAAVRGAAQEGLGVAVCGGRHAMGGQQFRSGGLLLDTTGMCRVVSLDRDQGVAEVEAGATWPAVIAATRGLQGGEASPWTIRQKQTGADELTLGGSVAANAHGRGLRMGPMVDDVEALTLIDAEGRLVRCSREENAELFALVVGGYGMFGVIASVSLRLQRLVHLRRHVEITDIAGVVARFEAIESLDARYGDFQFALHDDESNAFLRRGVLSVYFPTDEPPPAERRELTTEQWIDLLDLAHSDKAEAFRRYAAHYLSTHGQVYDSDTHQLSTYLPNYADILASRHSGRPASTLMITELYAPRERLVDLLMGCRDWLRRSGADPIYGTIRLIEPDRETALAWARERFACVVFNLRVGVSEADRAAAVRAFGGLIDVAIGLGGSFFLTSHRWATAEQVRACYPGFDGFLAAKKRLDPDIRFQSDWYHHYAGGGVAL